MKQEHNTVPEKPGKKRKLLLLLVGIAVCVAIAAVVPQLRASRPENTKAAVHTVAETTVTIVHPEKSGAVTLQLPGELYAYTDAPIYAQTSGYLKTWYFDIVAKVKANYILAYIDTPEVEQSWLRRRHNFR
jgi:multidrug efflux pump subunit AcrA (membrane-fusion protein)